MGAFRTGIQHGETATTLSPEIVPGPENIQMKRIKFESNYGFFAYSLSAEVGEELTAATEELCQQGLANIAYRVAGSAVDKALGVKTKEGKKYEKRNEVLYSEEDAERINAAVSGKITELENGTAGQKIKELKLSFSVTGEHEFGVSKGDSHRKAAELLWAKVEALEASDMKKFDDTLKTLGLDPENYTPEAGIEACRAKIAEAARAAKMGGLAI